MRYYVSETDGRTTIVDGDTRKSIANVQTVQDAFHGDGRFYTVATFDPELARRIVAGLALIDAVQSLPATASLES